MLQFLPKSTPTPNPKGASMTKAKQATTIASAGIDYDKYSNMTTSQLLNSLESAKKKRVKFQAQANNANALIDFLTDKIRDSLKKPKYDFVPYEKSGLPELAKKVKKQFAPKELVRLREELKSEISADYGDEL